jgi:hypothetical protein
MISVSSEICDKLSGQNANAADMTKKKLTYPVLLFVVVAAFYFAMPHAERGEGLRGDKLCRTLLAEKENREALSWLEQSKPGDIRTIGEQSPEDSLKIVKGLYSAGAVMTHVVGIERVTGYGESTNIVCVELPGAASTRKALFKIESKTASSEGFDPVPDEGQTYLFLYKFKLTFWQVLRSLVHT